MDTDLKTLKNFINEPHCDLGSNAWILADLVRTFKNSRFIDLGVRLGASSAIMSIDADKNNNQVCGCDLMFDGFEKNGARFVNSNYMCYQADSVTLGKNWDEDPFDIIFVDTIHTREQVLAELYFWSNHIKEDGYFIFHDSHWEKEGGDVIGGVEWKRVDEAITDFFNLPTSVMKMDTYENENISLRHYPGSYGMTFIQVKTLDSITKFKKNIDWNKVFQIRNNLNDLHFNRLNPKFIDWNQDIENIQNELVINP
ncbi:MAG: class I SAM-dependent methyltransferase [Caulobacteraceae bacterium]|nr:class I SAM-dependent methyltransferase [Caulobacteraceae bacterium]